jgi:hypothetical protein
VARGLTNAPLVIVVADEWFEHPEVLKLMSAGHRVYRWSADVMRFAAASPDLILHPAAHNWNDSMWEYLPAALTAARKRRRA